MPGTNLTRAEAAERAALIDVRHYAVELDLTVSETEFASTTVVTFSSREAGASTFADLVDGRDVRAWLNGTELDAAAYADQRLALDGLEADNELRVTARLPYSRTGEGLHRFVDPADGRVYLYTQFEVPDARRVYTTFEQPDLKATFTFTVDAPAGWTVISNAATPEPTEVRSGVERWSFAETKRMSTYITALVAGEYDVVTDAYKGDYEEIPLAILVRRSLREFLDADEILEVTKQGFAFFEDAFAMGYPFGKYDQAFVPEYNMGAMENAGAVTFRDEYIFRSRQTHAAYESRANTILHEMAHMWFGDLVTMKWWDDLWLNESFAEWASHYAEAKATRYTGVWTGFTNQRKNWAYRQDQLPSTHPIAADNYDLHAVEANFDGITYAKGASTLKQLVAWVGEEDFLAGLRAYFTKYAYGNTELADLLAELEEASGRDLHAWAQEWLQTSGVNTLRPAFQVDADGRFTAFAVEQTAAADYPTLRRHRIAIGLYDRTADGLVRRHRVETDITGASTPIPELLGETQPDLVLLNDDDLTYAKIRLDDRSLETLRSSIATIDSSLARALCWGSSWDMLRDAEVGARTFVEIVLAGVGTESDLTAVQSLLRQGLSAVTQYAAPQHRDALASRWETGLRRLLTDAVPGSDHQLALTRGYAAAARSDDAVAMLRGLLDGSLVLDGLTVDTDLRWTLVTALARTGAYGDAEIDAELERDRTIAGQEHAAGARAIRPDADAKAAAWDAVVVRDDLPNETQRSIATSFQVGGQAEVLAPYVARYLETAETVIEKGVWRASTILESMFPRANPSAETLATVDAWLATADIDPTTRRYVSEGRADLARALAAQERDAQG
ncbi:aminopeptidase N [Mumia flava]|uniref:Aminopeptidase N n=1 Tax=Mumia flava TaxID=1348852 RepID=A0A0B2BL52_9ACTN|nr:aminopeptidase N [Mumia flava]PJJ56418.1 aminopeptidase N [Mumia flava]